MFKDNEENVSVNCDANPFSKRPKNTVECFFAYSDSMAECSVVFVFSVVTLSFQIITLPFVLCWFVLKDISKLIKK